MANEDSTEIRRRDVPCPDAPRVCRYDQDRPSIDRSLRNIQGTLAEIQVDLKVGQQRFIMLERIVFGSCAVIGIAIIGGILATVIDKG